MLQRLETFLNRDTGAVTVDWVVICAAVIALCIAVSGSMGTTTAVLTGRMTTEMGERTIGE